VEQGAGQARFVLKVCYPDKGVLFSVVVVVVMVVVVVVRGTNAPAATLDGNAREVQYAAGIYVAF
jgi:hypothetical protein